MPINEKIFAKEVMVIAANGDKLGMLAIEDALKEAKNANLDLVQVSPAEAKPTVCKLLDYGKFQFNKKKVVLGQKSKKSKASKKLSSDLPLIKVITK